MHIQILRKHNWSVQNNGKYTTERLIERGFVLTWMEQPKELAAGEESEKTKQRESKSGKRIKYVCSNDECELAAWAKHEARLMCADHMCSMDPSE